MPALTQASRKRKNVSASKKNCVIASLAPRVYLAFEPFDIGLGVSRFGVLLGIGADPDSEIAGIGQRLDQLAGIGEAVGMRGEAIRTLWRVAAQGDDLGDASLVKAIGNREGLFAGRLDAGQVRRNIEAGGLVQGADRLAGQFARGACQRRT